MSGIRHTAPRDAERRIWQWAELTSLSLELMGVSIRHATSDPKFVVDLDKRQLPALAETAAQAGS